MSEAVMKVQFEMKPVTRDEVIEAMAAQLLGAEMTEDEDGNPVKYWDRTTATKLLEKRLMKAIDEKAEAMVRDAFDETIQARVTAAVDDVLAAGWAVTDGYGNRRGDNVDLKGRISELLTKQESSGYNEPKRTVAEQIAKKIINDAFHATFQPELERARLALRAQVDGIVSARLNETLKSALGLK
jgi:hypothetical protein